MLYRPEVKAVMIPAEDYCRDYRDPAQFMEYCKVCPRYGHLWCCPPFDFDTTKVLAEYGYVYIIGVRTTVDSHLRELLTDPQTIGEMTEFITKDCRRYVDGVLLGLEKAAPVFIRIRCALLWKATASMWQKLPKSFWGILWNGAAISCRNIFHSFLHFLQRKKSTYDNRCQRRNFNTPVVERR